MGNIRDISLDQMYVTVKGDDSSRSFIPGLHYYWDRVQKIALASKPE